MVFEGFQNLKELSQGAFSKENVSFKKTLPNIAPKSSFKDLGTRKRVPKWTPKSLKNRLQHHLGTNLAPKVSEESHWALFGKHFGHPEARISDPQAPR